MNTKRSLLTAFLNFAAILPVYAKTGTDPVCTNTGESEAMATATIFNSAANKRPVGAQNQADALIKANPGLAEHRTTLVNALEILCKHQGDTWNATHKNKWNMMNNGDFKQAIKTFYESSWGTKGNRTHQIDEFKQSLGELASHTGLIPQAKITERSMPQEFNEQSINAPARAQKILPSEGGFPIIDRYTDIPKDIESALWTAAQKTGLPYSFMVRCAFKESSFRSSAGASTSGARGLMQITEGTMLEYVHRYAEDMGHPELLEHVERYNTAGVGKDPVYRYRHPVNIEDKSTKTEDEIKQEEAAQRTVHREALLQARLDPEISASLTGAHLQRLAPNIAALIQRPPNQTDLYMMHFLGYGGARKFLKRHSDAEITDKPAIAMTETTVNKRTGAAHITGFDREESCVAKSAAECNGTIFFTFVEPPPPEEGETVEPGTPEEEGYFRARTAGEIYNHFAKTMTTEPATQQIPSATTIAQSTYTAPGSTP